MINKLKKVVPIAVSMLALSGCSSFSPDDAANQVVITRNATFVSEKDQELIARLRTFYGAFSDSFASSVTIEKQTRLLEDSSAEVAANIIELTKMVGDNQTSEETLVKFVGNIDPIDFDGIIDALFRLDEPNAQRDFLDLMLASDINVFTRWYKKALLLASKSTDEDLSFFARDTLEFYERDFQAIN